MEYIMLIEVNMRTVVRFVLLLLVILIPVAIFIGNRPSPHEAHKAVSSKEDARKQRFLLVIGCGRSGTKYMSTVLRASGLDVSHDYDGMGLSGTVSWLMTPGDADWAPWGPLSKDYNFRHILHQVRDPLKVIQSFYNFPPRATWEWVSLFIPEMSPSDSNLTKCAKYWYYWNLIAEKRAELTYRIEDFDTDYQIVGDQIGWTFDKQAVGSISTMTNTKDLPSYRVITWQILKDELDADLYDKVRSLALRYGYTPDQDK